MDWADVAAVGALARYHEVSAAEMLSSLQDGLRLTLLECHKTIASALRHASQPEAGVWRKSWDPHTDYYRSPSNDAGHQQADCRIDEDYHMAGVCKTQDGKWFWYVMWDYYKEVALIGTPRSHGPYATLKEAQADCDADLVRRGWRLQGGNS